MSDGSVTKWKLYEQKKWTRGIISTPDEVPTKKTGKILIHKQYTL